jgi:hypothetical protein
MREDNMKKKLTFIILGFFLLGCSNSSIVIPDISLVDESTAKTLLAQKTLIPNVQYEFSDSIEKGLVIKSNPEIGATAKPDQKVTIFISKGPSKIYATNSNVSWEDSRDKFQYFKDPFIEDGYFILDVELKFYKQFELKDFDSNGGGYGRASITDTFDKVVPLEIETSDKVLDPKDFEQLRIKIPVNDLDVQKPTTLYFQLYFIGETYDMNVSVSW